MKKTLTILFFVAVTIGATSCKSSWNCVCQNGSDTFTAATYKDTKFLVAVDKCNSKQADLRRINPNGTCSIK